jgi:hypothetical protein
MKNRRNFICLGLLLLIFGFPVKGAAQFLTQNNIVEVSGAVLSSESALPVSNAVISVLHQNRGVISNESGIYSIVCHPGDTLIYASVGFQSSTFTLPLDYQGRYFNRIQLMVQDTFYLPEMTIHALPSGDAFEYAFKYWPVIPTPEDRALDRFNKNEVNYLRATLPMNGAENATYFQQQQAVQGQYYGQQRNGIGILSPLSWAQFFDAWKRGDFRKKQY